MIKLLIFFYKNKKKIVIDCKTLLSKINFYFKLNFNEVGLLFILIILLYCI